MTEPLRLPATMELTDFLPAVLPGDDVPQRSLLFCLYDPDTLELLSGSEGVEEVVDTFQKWRELRADGANHYLTQLKLGDHNLGISTVYLNGNHNWLGGPPLMWETMVNNLGKSSNSWSDFQARYCNRRAAVNGHLVLANILMSVGMTVTTTNIEITAPEVALPAFLRPRAIGDS